MIENTNLIVLLELLGTFAFAVSGIKLASRKRFDWFGAYIIGFVTAIGGGTLRDLLLDVTPFWMLDPSYLIITGAALFAAILFKEKLFRLGSTLFLFDTIGLGIFTVAGISKSLNAGLPFWVCIIMGMITGSLGGIIRDVLINEVPLLFRKDVYALTCVMGGIIYFICFLFKFLTPFSEIIGALAVIFLRIIAVKYKIQLPILLSLDENTDEK